MLSYLDGNPKFEKDFKFSYIFKSVLPMYLVKSIVNAKM